MRFSMEYNFNVPIRFYNGYGRFTQLGEIVQNLGNRFLLVTGKHSKEKFAFCG